MRLRCIAFARCAALVSFCLASCGSGGDDGFVPAAGTRDRGAARTDGDNAPTEESARGEGLPTVVFLGDSISAGLHVDLQDAFPSVLQRRLAADGVPFRLVNGGVSGDTTAGGLRRVDWLLKQEPDWVVVELGGNDGLRGLELESIEANLRAIVDRVRAAGARVLLLGQKIPPNYGADYASGFEAVFRRVADAYELPFVPFFMEGVGGVPGLNFEDGIHPTEEGHRRIAEYLYPTLRALLLEAEGTE